MAKQSGSEFSVVGKVGGDDFQANINNVEFMREDILNLRDIWKGALPKYAGQIS